MHNWWSCTIDLIGRVGSRCKFAVLTWLSNFEWCLINLFVEDGVSFSLGPVRELIVLKRVQIARKVFDEVVRLYPFLESHRELTLGRVAFGKLSSVGEKCNFLV